MTTGRDDEGNGVVGPSLWGVGIGYMPTSWDLEADVVIIGAGATGLPAAIKAADEGVSVLVVDANYDVGGHAILSGATSPSAVARARSANTALRIRQTSSFAI